MIRDFTCLRGILAILFFYFIAWLLSEDKKLFSYKILFAGIGLQFLIAILLNIVPSIGECLRIVSIGFQAISNSTGHALKFCFGDLGTPDGPLGFILALHGFPVLIVVSALSSLLMYWGILPLIIKTFSWFFRKTLFIGGTLGISVSANMFTGMSETPLIIKPYLIRLTRSELFSLMTCGTTGIAGSMMVLYSLIIDPIMENSIVLIVSSVLIGIPAALTFSRIMVPETDDHFTEGDDVSFAKSTSALDAVFTGIMDGAKVMITIIAMFIGFISLIDILNTILSNIPIAGSHTSIQEILGLIFAPVMWLMGIPWAESGIAGGLLGTKIITNELVAYQELAKFGADLSLHTKIIIIYALCGFANIGSVGIILGIYSSLVPARKDEVVSMAFKAIIAGTLANCTTASIAGVMFFIFQ